jgi:DNA-binding Lrp family transcriptional regulator
MDAMDQIIVNLLQDDFPLCECPFERVAEALHMTEDELIDRIGRMVEKGTITRVGPLYNVERMGGVFLLAAMSVPQADLMRVAAILDAMPQVAHNYERDHELNMWFVLAAECRAQIAPAIARIERETGCSVVEMPKLREYFVGLKLDASLRQASQEAPDKAEGLTGSAPKQP